MVLYICLTVSRKIALHLWFFFQVESNPYHYDSHVQLIKLLRESGDLDKVRNARESMSKIFPLTQGNNYYSSIYELLVVCSTCNLKKCIICKLKIILLTKTHLFTVLLLFQSKYSTCSAHYYYFYYFPVCQGHLYMSCVRSLSDPRRYYTSSDKWNHQKSGRSSMVVEKVWRLLGVFVSGRTDCITRIKTPLSNWR